MKKYRLEKQISGSISVYELAHKIKEWIVKDGIYELNIYCNESDTNIELIGECGDSGEWGCKLFSITETSEEEAVFKVGQWKLEEMMK